MKILWDFFSNLKQRVRTLNGQVSTWTSDSVGIPQGSTLGPLLFLLYINDLSDNLSSNIKLFADDTTLFSMCLYIFLFSNVFQKVNRFIYRPFAQVTDFVTNNNFRYY